MSNNVNYNTIKPINNFNNSISQSNSSNNSVPLSKAALTALNTLNNDQADPIVSPESHEILTGLQVFPTYPIYLPEAVDKASLIAEKDGDLWKCVDVTDDDGGGRLFQFRLFDDVDPKIYPGSHGPSMYHFEVNREKFPAVETLADQLKFLIPSEKKVAGEKGYLLQELGYRLEERAGGTFLTLPDRDALLARLAKLREQIPGLPVLTIVSSEGIASDTEFTHAFIGGADAVLSSGVEFTHDHTAHLIQLFKILDDFICDVDRDLASYRPMRTKMANAMGKVYDLLQQARLAVTNNELSESLVKGIADWKKNLGKTPPSRDPLEAAFTQLETLMGIWVDRTTSSSRLDSWEEETNIDRIRSLPDIFRVSRWPQYMQKRYEENLLDFDELAALWDLLIKEGPVDFSDID